MNEILQEFTTIWIDKEGVLAIAEGELDGKKCIVVYISNLDSQLKYEIPDSYKEISVLVQESTGMNLPKE